MTITPAALAILGHLAVAPIADTEGLLCGQRTALVTALRQTRGEDQQVAELLSEKLMLELYRSSRSWTILVSTPEGLACILAWTQDSAPSLTP